MDEPVLYRRVPIAPLDCISQAWDRIRDQYWLFVGLCVAGLFLGSAVPMALLMGPLFCGIFYAYLEKWRGRKAGFEMLFKAFDAGWFVPSLVATLVFMAAMMLLLMPVIVIAVAGGILAGVAANARRGSVPEIGFVLVVLAAFAVVFFIALFLGLFFNFTYPLIVDRRLNGLEALKTSFRASLANIWGLMGLMLTTMVMGLAGALCCYVGAFLVLPITFGAQTAAYVKVFGLSDSVPVANPGVNDR
jgi:hypothetical protein